MLVSLVVRPTKDRAELLRAVQLPVPESRLTDLMDTGCTSLLQHLTLTADGTHKQLTLA